MIRCKKSLIANTRAKMSGMTASLGVVFISLTASITMADTASLPAFPIQSYSAGSSADVWVVRTDNSIEYCRSEQRNDVKGSSERGAAIKCYPQDQPDGFRFASVEAIISSNPAVASAYAMTSSGQLVYCRVSGNSKQSKKLLVRCHL